MILVNNFRYQDVFVLLVQEILVKMQFKHNRAQLEELDDESLDDDVSHKLIYSLHVIYFLPVDYYSHLFNLCLLYKLCQSKKPCSFS